MPTYAENSDEDLSHMKTYITDSNFTRTKNAPLYRVIRHDIVTNHIEASPCKLSS